MLLRLCVAVIFLISCNQKNNSSIPSIQPVDPVNKIVPVKPVEDKKDSSTINTNEFDIILKPVPISLSKGINFTLNIPVDYNISIAAEGLKRLRFVSKSPDGKLFATDMYDRSDNSNGKVLIFDKWDDENKKFQQVDTFLDKLHNPNQVAFYDKFIYVAETGMLSRYVYKNGDSRPSSSKEIIASFPDYGLSYKYGGWHLTRSLAFHNDKIYVSVGSSCNACIENEEVRASILEMDPDGRNKKVYARGLRNSVGIKWIGDQLWGTGMGRDLIGPDKPEDVLQKIDRDEFYGWPYYFQYRGNIFEDTQFSDSIKPSWVKKPEIAFCGFKAHSAPLGFDYFKGFNDPLFENSILVALHGSTSVWRERGNSIVKAIGKNKYLDVVTGFLGGKTEAERYGRPCDILMNDDHSFFITDDHNGVLYYLWR